jgi:putative FmdB family regulatory protein
MPIYDYECRQCGQRCEVFQRTPEAQVGQCLNCGSERLERLVSPFSVLGSRTEDGTTCCGRDTRCDSPPCSVDDVCRRR